MREKNYYIYGLYEKYQGKSKNYDVTVGRICTLECDLIL